MTEQEVRELLDLEKIRAWAEAQDPNAYVGQRRRAHFCPVARYLSQHGAPDPIVTPMACQPDANAEKPQFTRLPNELGWLVLGVDKSGRSGSQVRARTFLGLIDAVRSKEGGKA